MLACPDAPRAGAPGPRQVVVSITPDIASSGPGTRRKDGRASAAAAQLAGTSASCRVCLPRQASLLQAHHECDYVPVCRPNQAFLGVTSCHENACCDFELAEETNERCVCSPSQSVQQQQSLREPAAASGGRIAAVCSDQQCTQAITSATFNTADHSPRTLLETVRRLANVGDSNWFSGGNSLAEDLSGSSVQPYQPDSSLDQFSGTSDVIGGLRSPDTPALQDEGSGMIWTGKGVAPIIKSVPHLDCLLLFTPFMLA